MSATSTSRFVTLVLREFREYRNSMLWTPLITALLLGLLMLGSVVLVNRISVFGDAILDAVMDEGSSGNGVSFSISVGEDETEDTRTVKVITQEKLAELSDEHALEYQIADGDTEDLTNIVIPAEDIEVGVPPAPDAPPAPYEVIVVEDEPEEAWNFSREWSFNPDLGEDDEGKPQDFDGSELNPILSVVHGILILILLVTTANYLLSALYDDRKDRSILFWRSMPVSEWEVVISKYVVAIILTPLVYIAISLVLQLSYVMLMMLLVWRMDKDPFEVVLGNVDFVALMLDPISGWLMTILLIAPTYAWLLFASALARRSPFMMAVAPVIGLVIAEGLFFGTDRIGTAITRHFPHVSDVSAVGFYLFGPDWTDLNLASVAAGIVFAAVALFGAVWLRQHRWELK